MHVFVPLILLNDLLLYIVFKFNEGLRTVGEDFSRGSNEKKGRNKTRMNERMNECIQFETDRIYDHHRRSLSLSTVDESHHLMPFVFFLSPD